MVYRGHLYVPSALSSLTEAKVRVGVRVRSRVGDRLGVRVWVGWVGVRLGGWWLLQWWLGWGG